MHKALIPMLVLAVVCGCGGPVSCGLMGGNSNQTIIYVGSDNENVAPGDGIAPANNNDDPTYDVHDFSVTQDISDGGFGEGANVANDSQEDEEEAAEAAK